MRGFFKTKKDVISEKPAGAAADKKGGGAKAAARPLKRRSLLVYLGVCLALVTCVAIFLRHLALWINLSAYAIFLALMITACVTYFINKPAAFRLCITVTISMALILLAYIILDQTGVFDTLNNMELIKNFILSTGMWGRLVFVLVQIAQVVFLPLPAILINLTGVALYGPAQGFFLSLIGTLIGSVIAFTVGKVFGKKLVSWIVGKEDADKYRKMFDKKGRFIFILMLVFPIFPDDMLCMVAGITTMSYGYFTLAVLLSRPWGLAATCFFGSGQIIPFRGWGLAVWAVILILLALTFFFVNKHNKKIMAFFNKRFGKTDKAEAAYNKALLFEAADIEPDTKIFAKARKSPVKPKHKKRN